MASLVEQEIGERRLEIGIGLADRERFPEMGFGKTALSLPRGHLGQAGEDPLAYAGRCAGAPLQRIAQALVTGFGLPGHARRAGPACRRDELAGEALEHPAA